MKYESRFSDRKSAQQSPDSASFTEKFLPDAKQRAIEWGKKEKQRISAGLSAWEFYERPISSLDARAGALLPQSFTDFLAERRAQNGRVKVMDLMGTGGFMEEYQVDEEVAVTLVDHRDDPQKKEDKKRGKIIIAADIMEEETWEAIAAHGPFDLVTCQPYGGWTVIKGNIHAKDADALLAEHSVVNRMVSTLAPDGGMLVVDLSGATPYNQWTNELQAVPGIKAACSRNTDHYLLRKGFVDDDSLVRITRTDEVYGELPFLPQD